MSHSSGRGGLDALRSSQTVRLLVVGGLVLLLLIPVAMIGALIAERQQRRETAVADVSAAWGHAQAITGPALVVPYTRRTTELTADGRAVTTTAQRSAVVLPERLEVRGRIETETLRRGIFSVPVYRLRAEVRGTFARPDLSEVATEGVEAHWDRARLVVGISDARAIQEETVVAWSGEPVPFLPGTAGLDDVGPGIHAPVPLAAPDAGVAAAGAPAPLTFAFPLALNGSEGLRLAPFGRNTVVELESSFPSPSFQGTWLPTERSVTDDGFRARWSIPFLGRNYPQAWTSSREMREAIDASQFGVDLVNPVDHYSMARRSVKYAVMFLLLTFAAVWLMEVLAGVRVHPIQYLMLGAALCLFYILELSLSEHLGFLLAYVLAILGVIAMVGSYSRAVLDGTGRAVAVGTGVAALYLYLYVLLMNEDYALLIGSVGLFGILGTIMYATRHVDWFALGPGGSPAGEPARR
jgi:inner membrane protein